MPRFGTLQVTRDVAAAECVDVEARRDEQFHRVGREDKLAALAAWCEDGPLLPVVCAFGSQLVEQLDAGMHRARMRDVDAQARGELHDRPGHALELEPLAGFQVLQHRRLVVADRDPGLEAPV
jgi:hypothetical protein